MNDNLNRKEQKIKSILEDISVDIDSNELWLNIESKVKPRKTNRRPIFFLILGMLVLAFIGGYYVATVDTSELVSEIVNEVEQNKNAGKNSVEQITEMPDKTLEEYKEKIEEDSSLFKNETRVPTHNSILSSDQNIPNFKNSNQNEMVVTKSSFSEDNFTVTQPSTTNPKKEFINDNIDISNRLAELIPNKGNSIISEFGFLKTKSLLLEQESEKIIFNIDFVDPLLNINHARYFFYAGFGLFNNNVDNTILDSSIEDALNSQFDRETALSSWSGSLLIGKELKNSWNLSAGLFVNNLVTRYRKVDENVSELKQTGTQLIEYDDNGEATFTDGLVEVDRIVDYDLTWHKNQMDVDLQFGVGKQLFSIGKFETLIQTHLAYNLYRNISGYGYDAEGTFFKIEENTENVYKSNSGLKLMIDLPIQYHFNNISIDLRPYYRTYLNDDIVGSSLYKIKNSQLGITLGVMYRPNWE